MGVSGSGKTTIGRTIADRLGWAFLDADDFHPPENRAKMRAGIGLTDADRTPWLAAVRGAIERHLERGKPVVVACSALKRSYRQELGAEDPRVRFVWLDVSETKLRTRLAERQGHYAGTTLLPSQLDALEPPALHEAIRVEADGSVEETTRAVIDTLAS